MRHRRFSVIAKTALPAVRLLLIRMLDDDGGLIMPGRLVRAVQGEPTASLRRSRAADICAAERYGPNDWI